MRWILLAVALMIFSGCDAAKDILGENAPGGDPSIMTRVIISTEGGGYKVQYSFQDSRLRDTDASGTLVVEFIDREDPETKYYFGFFNVKKDKFKKYKTILNAEIWAHVFIIPASDVTESGSGKFVDVKLVFVTNDQERFEVNDTIFL